MSRILITTLLVVFTISLFAQQNITFRSQLTYPGLQLANIGGYADGSGKEYALVGTSAGLSIVDVTDPDNPDEKVAVPGLSSSWREVKTFQHYAYVTTEAGGGLQIINLQYLPDSVQVKQYTGDGAIAGQLANIHALHVDGGYVYLYGGSLFSGAAKICDLNQDPWNPVYKGHTPGPYIHDGYVRNDTLWAAHIYSGYVGVYDVSNKTNPVLLASQNTPNNFPHNTWLSGNGNFLFTTDETSNSYLTAYNVDDLSNIYEMDRIQIHPGDNSAIHNTHIKNNYAISSWYTSGVSIVDVSKPGHMIQIGYYDTSPNSGAGFSGCWGVYPFLPSGNLVASDMQQGLFVLTPNYVRACHLTGTVKDAQTNQVLGNVLVEIVGTPENDLTKITGKYSTGLAAAGTYSIRFSKAGYVTQVKTGITLTNNVFTTLNVSLTPVNASLTPVSDSYVRSGIYASANYGSVNRLYAKKASTTSDADRISYLRFNISGIGINVSNAKLRVYAALNSTGSPSVDVNVHHVSNNTWQEPTINYNNKPSVSPTVSGTATIASTTWQFYEWDITTLVQQRKTAGDSLISLVIQCPVTTTNNYVKFYSRESGSNKPQLVVASTARMAQEEGIITPFANDREMPFDLLVSGNKVLLKNIDAKNDFIFSLFDLSGKIIYREIIHRDVEMEVPIMVKGIYILNFRNADFNVTRKYSFQRD